MKTLENKSELCEIFPRLLWWNKIMIIFSYKNCYFTLPHLTKGLHSYIQFITYPRTFKGSQLIMHDNDPLRNSWRCHTHPLFSKAIFNTESNFWIKFVIRNLIILWSIISMHTEMTEKSDLYSLTNYRINTTQII